MLEKNKFKSFFFHLKHKEKIITNHNEIKINSDVNGLSEQNLNDFTAPNSLVQFEKNEKELNISFVPGEFTNKILSVRLSRKRFNLKTLILFVCLITLSIAMFFITVCVWPSAINFGHSAIFAFHMGWRLQSSKLPAIIIAAIGLSLGGYIVQQVTQNRLADTSILGISTVNIVLLVIVLRPVLEQRLPSKKHNLGFCYHFQLLQP